QSGAAACSRGACAQAASRRTRAAMTGRWIGMVAASVDDAVILAACIRCPASAHASFGLPAMNHSSTDRWRLDGQVALVCGASQGIGLACARELQALGAELLLVARDAVQLDRAADELADMSPSRPPRVFAADLSDGEQRRELFDWVNDQGLGLQILIN